MAAHPARQPTEAEIRQFEEDGAVALKGVYQPRWIELLRAGVDVAMATSDRYRGASRGRRAGSSSPTTSPGNVSTRSSASPWRARLRSSARR